MRNKVKKFIPSFILILILSIGAFLRFYKLNEIPFGLFPDEAANGLDAIGILEGKHAIFFPANGGREPLFIYLIALSFKLLGISSFSIRFTSAIIGLLTILVVYLLIKELFNNFVALLTAYFLATSHWHLIISRDGFRAILVPLFLSLVLLLLLKALKSKKFFYFLGLGFILGLGFYTYPAYWTILFIVGFYLLLEKSAIDFKALKFKFLTTFLTFLLTIFPLLIFLIHNPKAVIGRPYGVSIFKNFKIEQFLINLKKTILQFSFQGDLNFRHNFANYPMLGYFLGFLFVLGLALFLINLYQKKYAFVLALLFFTLLPQIFSIENIPHGLRSLGSLPIALLIVSFLIFSVYQRIKFNKIFIYGFSLVLSFILGFNLYQTYDLYFNKWANSFYVLNAYSEDLVKISDFLLELKPKEKVYILFDEYYLYYDQTIKFLTYKREINYQLIPPWEIKNFKPSKPSIIIFSVSAKKWAFDFIECCHGAKLIKSEYGKHRNYLFSAYKYD